MAPLQGLVAHGGTGGAIAEVLLVVSIAAIFFAVWLRELRAGRSRDKIRPQERGLSA